jgi:hypothetical protein
VTNDIGIDEESHLFSGRKMIWLPESIRAIGAPESMSFVSRLDYFIHSQIGRLGLSYSIADTRRSGETHHGIWHT